MLDVDGNKCLDREVLRVTKSFVRYVLPSVCEIGYCKVSKCAVEGLFAYFNSDADETDRQNFVRIDPQPASYE
jgi:hypothetical protein